MSIVSRPASSERGAGGWIARGTVLDLPSRFGEMLAARGSQERWRLASAAAPGAIDLPDDAFKEKAAELISRAIHEACAGPEWSLARLWAFIPGINAPSSYGDRYMCFNLGRGIAFDHGVLPRPEFPASTGIGHAGESLVIHCLSTRGRVRPVENPRQTPAWRYSARFGPRPPLFARACVIDFDTRDSTEIATPHSSIFLAGGTASVVGEQSQHEGDFAGQCEETWRNLTALASRAGLTPDAAFASLRVHVRRHSDVDDAERWIRSVLPAARVDFAVAPICRRELLLEVEGSSALS